MKSVLTTVLNDALYYNPRKSSPGRRPLSVEWRFHAGSGGGTGPSKSCLAPKFSRTLDTLWSIDSQRKIGKFDATRRQILRLKCTKFDFCCGSVPDPARGTYSAPPGPLAVFKGPSSKGKEGKRETEKGGMRRGRERKGREEEGGGKKGKREEEGPAGPTLSVFSALIVHSELKCAPRISSGIYFLSTS